MWIDVNESEPNQGELVLVKGSRADELSNETEISIGLVVWYRKSYSSVKDKCAYDVYYTNITHWKRIE